MESFAVFALREARKFGALLLPRFRSWAARHPGATHADYLDALYRDFARRPAGESHRDYVDRVSREMLT